MPACQEQQQDVKQVSLNIMYLTQICSQLY